MQIKNKLKKLEEDFYILKDECDYFLCNQTRINKEYLLEDIEILKNSLNSLKQEVQDLYIGSKIKNKR